MRDAAPDNPVQSLAAGALRAADDEAWTLIRVAWPTLERFVRVRLIYGGLQAEYWEDCGQEVFTRVWRFRKSYHGTSEPEFWRWMRQICDNERRRLLRREAPRRTEALPAAPDGDCDDRIQTEASEMVNAAALSEELLALRDCLRDLDTRWRSVIELIYFEPGLSERAIAEIFDCSPSNVHRLKIEGLRHQAACLGRKGIR